MSSFLVGIRKYVETEQVHYWLLITAKAIVPENEGKEAVGFSRPSFSTLYIQLINSAYWKIFIIVTVMFNLFIFITYFWLQPKVLDNLLIVIIVLLHVTCFFYWIDFLGAIIEKYVLWHGPERYNTRPVICLIFDAVSLLPLSTLYLISIRNINVALLWKLRGITVIRFYRMPRFFSQLSSSERNHWNILLITYSCYFIIFIIIFANIFVYRVNDYSPVSIQHWNDSPISRMVVSLYYVIEIVFNVGYGDMEPISYPQILLNAFAMCIGTAASTGIFSGVLGIAFTSKAITRELYRYEYEATRNTLIERKIEKKVMTDILDNMDLLWKWKKGNRGPPPIHVLPLSLQREMFFDVNFPQLHRSLIFSMQPRSFLRSVSMFMKNVTYLPGDIILEPSGMSDVMICVASGVIEVLSEQNDESVLLSLTTGTIIGEATLFIPLPVRCFIRASTYVELQVLMKVHFARLALTYPEIFRSMRTEIFRRLQFKDETRSYPRKGSVYPDPKRRRETKKFISTLKRVPEGYPGEGYTPEKLAILGLYTLSENIPRVKTLPIYLIRARPWILRPDTTFTKFWNLLIVTVIAITAIMYPVMAAFVRKIHPWMYAFHILTRAFYVADVYLQCTTAIERKDHFTYITTIKEIVSHKLKTFGFYLDIISMYYLGIYAELVWPENVDYANLLLSLNVLLKTWQVFRYLRMIEDDLKNNLLIIVTVKYVLCMCFIVTWGAVLLYVEARPGESYVENRWFYYMEVQEVNDKSPAPRSVSPAAVSFYFATVTIMALGYGDIVAKTIIDCLVVIICMVAGFILVISCVAESSAAIKHLARIRTNYQEELFAVDLFMAEHEISKVYRDRVRNYMRVQWDYDKGYSLKQISISHGLPGLQRRIIVLELSKSFLSVQLFREVEPDFLKHLARLCKVRVLPPEELVTIKGSFTREMYILENGFCEVTREDENGIQTRVIGPLSPFGVLEMITGAEQRLHVETLTHVRIISLNYASFLQAVTKYPSVKIELDEAMEGYDYDDEDAALGFGYVNESEPDVETNLKIQKHLASQTFINVYKYHKTIGINYWTPFEAWGKCRVLQFLFIPYTIRPDSLLLKTWTVIRIIRAMIVCILAPIQFSILSDFHEFMIWISVMQVFAAIDMYFMFLVSYYDERGLLMFHPAKTACNYLKGGFITDLIIVFPYYWLLSYFYPHARGYRKFFIQSSGMIMILQLYKFFQGFRYLENNILRKTDVIKIMKLLPFVVVVINCITGFVLLLQCYKTSTTNVSELQGSTRLAKELVNTIREFCTYGPTNTTEPDEEAGFKMYLIALYWVTTTITVCGFGDITAHNETTMIIVILILTLGIFFFSYVFSSITSSMVTTNILISKHRQYMLRVSKFMKSKNVNPELQRRVVLHYEYNWKRTEGESPQKMFSYVHAGLREGIIRSMYEATISQNPAFRDLEGAILSIIGRHLEELYFLQGETIIKYKDILEHIYIIYRGEVHVLDGRNQFLAAMGNGGVFGNISNKSFSLSSETVIASENVDLIRMDRKAFFSELQMIPNAKDLLTYLTTKVENYIRPDTSPATSAATYHPMKINVFRLGTVPLERRSASSSQLYHVSGFAFKKMIFFLRFKPYSTFVILPGSLLENGIEICIFVMAYLSSTLTFYMFAFQDFSPSILIFLYILDVFFLFELYLQFHMSYSDKFGECLVEMASIRARYKYSRKFFFDIISDFPLEIFLFMGPRHWWGKLLSIFRLNRTLRLHYIVRYYFKKRKALMTNKIVLEVGLIFVVVTLMIHLLACIWFVAVAPLGFYQQPTWVTDMDLLGKQAWEYYIFSVFHIVVITTTTGLQKIRIYSIPEVVLTMIFMITCRYVVVLLSGLMAATINADSLTLFTFQQRIIELKDFFSRQNMSDYQLHKMWNYLTTLWSRERGKQISKFISMAPYTMKCEVMTAMFGKHLAHSYVFSPTDLTFLRQLASHLKRFVYFPGNYIVQQGDIDYTMYFIHKGEVSVLTIHPELIETIHFKLTENDHFGMKQGLIIGKAHDFSYRAETEVEILSLTLSDWHHLLKYYPEDAQKINKRIEELPETLE